MLEIKVFRYYKTRNGRKVGPMRPTDNSYWPFWSGEMYYKANGYSCPGVADFHDDKDDLIDEWADA